MGNFAQDYLGEDFSEYMEYLNDKMIEKMFEDLERIDDGTDLSMVRERTIDE